MATITVTASAAAQPRVARGAETITVRQVYNRSVSSSDTDIFYFQNLKIPHGATITRVDVIHDSTDGAAILKAGLVGGVVSGDVLFSSLTVSGTQAIDTLLPVAGLGSYRVSISDDNPIRFGVFALTQDGAVASPTGSMSIEVIIQYTMTRD